MASISMICLIAVAKFSAAGGGGGGEGRVKVRSHLQIFEAVRNVRMTKRTQNIRY